MNYNKINIITIMDYNWSIPDIYSNGITKSFDEKLKKYEYNIKPNDKFLIDLKYYFIYFETDYTNLYINDEKIWNRRILFCNKIYNRFIIQNYSDEYAQITIYVYYHESKTEKEKIIRYGGSNDHKDIIYMISYYNNSSSIITYNIYMETTQEIKIKIISLQSFNIKIYYKVKLISKNNNYSYILNICHIENTLNNSILYIDSSIDNLSDILPKYNKIKSDLKKFMKDNHKYLNDNNIQLPYNIKDEDGWIDNIYYNFCKINFNKKYNIVKMREFKMII